MMTPEELVAHKALLARMGMSYTEVYGPSDMSLPSVQTRMTEVAATAVRVPSVFNAQNDFDLGNQVRMLTRTDSGHEGVVCAARDRIFQLSLRVAALEAALTDAAGTLEEAADKFWVIHCNHPGEASGRAQGEDKAFLATMHDLTKAAGKTARAALTPKAPVT